MKCRRLLKPLIYPHAQMDGAVKTAEGEALAGALTGTDSCATSRYTEVLLLSGNGDQLGRYIGVHQRS